MNIQKNIESLNGKRILVTGAKGMLGMAFTDLLKKHTTSEVLAFGRNELDVTKSEQILLLKKENIDIIIHCAAKVDANFCENNEDLSYESIVIGTKNIANLAQELEAVLLYPQSFLIFDEITDSVDENTIPNPLSIYGKHKYEAEKYIIDISSNYLVIRMGGFFGGYEKDKNFVGKFIPHVAKLIKQGIYEQEVGDRIWQPTYTKDLALNCLLLLANSKAGIYNMASHGEASFYELSSKITQILKLSNQFSINKVSGEKFKNQEAALRPMRCVLSNKKLQREGLDIQRPWVESLEDYLNHDYFKNLFL